MAKGLVALEAQISALAQADAEKRVAKVMKAARVIAKALAKVAKQMSSFQKAAGGKARPGRKPGRKPGRRPGRRPGRKPGRKPAVKRGGMTGITPAALKSLRKRLGVNQDGLAKLLKVSLSSIRTWEQGRAKPRKAKLAKILALQAKR